MRCVTWLYPSCPQTGSVPPPSTPHKQGCLAEREKSTANTSETAPDSPARSSVTCSACPTATHVASFAKSPPVPRLSYSPVGWGLPHHRRRRRCRPHNAPRMRVWSMPRSSAIRGTSRQTVCARVCPGDRRTEDHDRRHGPARPDRWAQPGHLHRMSYLTSSSYERSKWASLARRRVWQHAG
jgi:hypothetical protein